MTKDSKKGGRLNFLFFKNKNNKHPDSNSQNLQMVNKNYQLYNLKKKKLIDNDIKNKE